MPTYTYADPGTGLEIDVRRPVADRDKPIVLHRTGKVPKSVGVRVAGAAPADPLREQIRRGYRRLEEKHGSRFRSEHGAAIIKETWKI